MCDDPVAEGQHGQIRIHLERHQRAGQVERIERAHGFDGKRPLRAFARGVRYRQAKPPSGSHRQQAGQHVPLSRSHSTLVPRAQEPTGRLHQGQARGDDNRRAVQCLSHDVAGRLTQQPGEERRRLEAPRRSRPRLVTQRIDDGAGSSSRKRDRRARERESGPGRRNQEPGIQPLGRTRMPLVRTSVGSRLSEFGHDGVPVRDEDAGTTPHIAQVFAEAVPQFLHANGPDRVHAVTVATGRHLVKDSSGTSVYWHRCAGPLLP